MNNLHPDWQTTDGSSTSEKVQIATGDHPIANAEECSIPIAGVHVSRQPAAILGILLVIGIGAGFFQSVETLRGELMTEVSVRITEEGFVPENIQLAEGQGVVWTNETQIPHVIQSDALCDQTAACLDTHTIFSGEQARYRLPEAAPSGNYGYRSATANIEGIIQVGSVAPLPSSSPQKPAAPAQDPVQQLLENNTNDFITVDDLINSFASADVESQDVGINLPPQTNTAPAPVPSTPIPEPIAAPVVPEPVPPAPPPAPKQIFRPPPGVGINDLTVAWQERNPIEDLQANIQQQLPASERNTNQNTNVQKYTEPFNQPKTGPGILFAGFGSICGFMVAMRKVGGKARA